MLRSLQPDHRCSHLARKLRITLTIRNEIPPVRRLRVQQIQTIDIIKIMRRLLVQLTFWIEHNRRRAARQIAQYVHQECCRFAGTWRAKDYYVAQPLNLIQNQMVSFSQQSNANRSSIEPFKTRTKFQSKIGTT